MNVETYALHPEDRGKLISKLGVESEDYYYYTVLLKLATDGATADVTKLIDSFAHNFGEYNTKVRELRLRSHLMMYDQPLGILSRLQKSKKSSTIEYILENVIDTEFDHVKPTTEGGDDAVTYPSTFNGRKLDVNKLIKDTWSSEGISGFEGAAIPFLVNAGVSDSYNRDCLLEHVNETCSLIDTTLPKMLVKDLKDKDYGGSFGSKDIHSQLTIEQMDTLRAKYSDVVNDEFIRCYIMKLRGGPESASISSDPETCESFLNSAWSFVSGLGPAFLSYKATVLYRRLYHDHYVRGRYNKARFMEYIKMPRHGSSVPDDVFDEAEYTVDYWQSVDSEHIKEIEDDTQLIEKYLTAFMSDPEFTINTLSEYSPYIRIEWLKRVLAETKLLCGQGTHETWYKMLDSPSTVEELNSSSEITMVPHNPTVYGPTDSVVIEADVKNVKQLIVKIYEINTRIYYTKHRNQVSTDIDLVGLVANSEEVHDFSKTPPIQCVRRRFEFSDLRLKRGIFVIEFIGGGKSSRAVLRKGYLRYLQRVSIAGHVLTCINEKNEVVDGAKILADGHEYTADDDGEIVLPFSGTSNSTTSLILIDGDFAYLDSLSRLEERISMNCGIYVDRESLMTGTRASISVKPVLSVCGVSAPLKLLLNPELVIKSVDSEGTDSELRVPDFTPKDDYSTLVHTFNVTPNLRQLTVTFECDVKKATTGEKMHLHKEKQFSLNAGEDSMKSFFLHFAQGSDGQYRIEALGKCGEPRVGVVVNVEIKHGFLTETITDTLQTNEDGVILLGPLDNCTTVSTDYGHEWYVWMGANQNCRWPAYLQGCVGSPLRLPSIDRKLEHYSLVEKRGGTVIRDCHDHISIDEHGVLELDELLSGDYSLRYLGCLAAQSVVVRVGGKADIVEHAVSNYRSLQINGHDPLSISDVSSTDGLVVKLVNFNVETTRVNVVGTHFSPLQDLSQSLGVSTDLNPTSVPFSPMRNVFFSNRGLGDEQRYVLDRKYQDKSTGMMLTRPSLLLNPWVVGSTKTTVQNAKQGDEYGRLDPCAVNDAIHSMNDLPRECFKTMATGSSSGEMYPALDFLPHPAMVLMNLVPDTDGIVRIPLDEVPQGVRVLKIVATDGTECVSKQIVSASVGPINYQNISLKPGFSYKKHYRESKGSVTLHEGGDMVIDDILSGQVEVYDSIPKLLALFTSLSPSSDSLSEFNPVFTTWPTMNEKAKLDFYGPHACHELNFFLKFKDPDFFGSVVGPFIKDKLYKTPMDDFLLATKDDKASLKAKYVDDRSEFYKLNIVEQILACALCGGEVLSQFVAVLREQMEGRKPNRHMIEAQLKASLSGMAMDSDDNLQNQIADMKEEVMATEVEMLDDDDDFGPPMEEPCPAPAMAMLSRAMIVEEEKECDEEEMEAPKMREECRKESKKKKSKAKPKSSRSGRKQDKDMDRRTTTKQLFRQAEKTMEYSEMNYWKVRAFPLSNSRELVSTNTFWLAYAEFLLTQIGAGVAGGVASAVLFASGGSGLEKKELFLPSCVPDAAGSFTEMMFAMGVLSLPWTPTKPKVDFDHRKMTITAKTPAVAFYRQIDSFEAADSAQSSVLVAQHYYDPNNRYTEINGQSVERYLEQGAEMVVGKVYACQIATTNVTSSYYPGLDMLVQIPRGAVPVDTNSIVTKSRSFDLSSYTTNIYEYKFYFPYPGSFTHFPVHILDTDGIVAVSEPLKLTAVVPASAKRVVAMTWLELAASGSNDEVLEYLKNGPIAYKNLTLICWRMKDSKFAKAAIEALANRGVYSHDVWSYSLKHIDAVDDVHRKEYLAAYPGGVHRGYTCDGCRTVPIVGTRWKCGQCHDFDLCPGCHASGIVTDTHTKTHYMRAVTPSSSSSLASVAGPELYTTLLSTPAVSSGLWEHLEYKPLINARAHALGKQEANAILNDKQKVQYTNLLNVACHSTVLSNELKLAIVYHLLLQDRYTDAAAMFATCEKHQDCIPSAYIEAYLDFCTGSLDAFPDRAKEIVTSIMPTIKVPLWRRAFEDMASQLREIEGVDSSATSTAQAQDTEGDRDRQHAKLASTEPSISVESIGNTLSVTHLNVSEMDLSFFLIDVELLFSVTPFSIGSTDSGMAGIIKPTKTMKTPLTGNGTTVIDIPTEIKGHNAIIELTSGGIHQTIPFFSSTLSLTLVREYGQGLVVSDGGKPIIQAYFKCYARRKDGQVQFLKDGYTDRRGRFDYCSLSTDALDSAAELAVLVVDDDSGACVKTVPPPQR